MSYKKAIEKTKKEKINIDWCKNAMDYNTKVDGLFMPTKGVEKLYQATNTSDMVNHPPHYNKTGIETIDIIESITGKGFDYYLQGNIIKYICRYRYKNGAEDLKKAKWYLNKLIEVTDDNTG